MRKLGIIVGSVVVLAVVGWLALPELLAVAINLTCRQPLSESCQARVRALGDLYLRKGNIDRAIGWYEWGADSNDRVAMFGAAWAHSMVTIEALRRQVQTAVREHGDIRTPAGPSAHDLAAFEWYCRSAKAGFAPAMNNLAQIYRYGFIDPRLTFEWDSRAAQLGNPIAQLNLAADLQQGYGTQVDALKAQYWATAPLPVKDPADIAEPTFSRTLVVGAGNERMIAAMKRIGDLPENWDLAPVIARAREQ